LSLYNQYALVSYLLHPPFVDDIAESMVDTPRHKSYRFVCALCHEMALATLDISKVTDGGRNLITLKEEHTTSVVRSEPKFAYPSPPRLGSFSVLMAGGNERERGMLYGLMHKRHYIL
jgi:hypothetical protein